MIHLPGQKARYRDDATGARQKRFTYRCHWPCSLTTSPPQWCVASPLAPGDGAERRTDHRRPAHPHLPLPATRLALPESCSPSPHQDSLPHENCNGGLCSSPRPSAEPFALSGRIMSRPARSACGAPRHWSARTDNRVFRCTPRKAVTRSETWPSQVSGGGCNGRVGYPSCVARGNCKPVARALASCQAG
jgi:hypothetical protein